MWSMDSTVAKHGHMQDRQQLFYIIHKYKIALPSQFSEVGTIIPILQMRELRPSSQCWTVMIDAEL